MFALLEFKMIIRGFMIFCFISIIFVHYVCRVHIAFVQKGFWIISFSKKMNLLLLEKAKVSLFLRAVTFADLTEIQK